MKTSAPQDIVCAASLQASRCSRIATLSLLLACGLSACAPKSAPAPPTGAPPPVASIDQSSTAPAPAATQTAPPPAPGGDSAVDSGGGGDAVGDAAATTPIIEPSGGAAPSPAPPPASPTPHYQVSGPQQPLHGPENKDITLLLSLDLPQEQLQNYYDSHFKNVEAPAVERTGSMPSYQARFTHLRASIDCGDGHAIRCTPMAGYATDIDTVPGVMVWRWNVVGVDDGQTAASRTQDVRIVVLGASDAAGPYERIDSIPDIPLQVKVDALTTAERLIAAWTHLANSIKGLLLAVIAAIGVLTAWLRSTFKKGSPPAT